MVDALTLPQTGSDVVTLVGEDMETRWRQLFAEYSKKDIEQQLADDVETLWRTGELAEDDDDKEMVAELIAVANRLRLEAQAL